MPFHLHANLGAGRSGVGAFRTMALVMAGLLACQSGQAAIAKFFGWGYSENKKYKEVLSYIDDARNVLGVVGKIAPPVGAKIALVRMAIDIIDPSSFEGIVSGRVTLKFDPSYQVALAGWFGEFGADPTLAAPPVPVPLSDNGVDLLQLSPNPAMKSSSLLARPARSSSTSTSERRA